jgi:hypothetical protein
MFRYRGDTQPILIDSDEEKGHSTEKTTKKTSSPFTDKLKFYFKFFLICLCFYGFLILMETGLGSISIEEDLHHSHDSREHYTVVINTFERPDYLIGAVDHYSKCLRTKYIHIVWSEKAKPSNELLDKYSKQMDPQVIFDIYEQDSLNNRFTPLKGSSTDGIFSVDDDMRVPCLELDFAFDVWRSNRENIVGFMPRTHVHSATTNRLIYRAWWYIWRTGSYSMILTKAAFLHQKYYHEYTQHLPQEMKDYIDQNRNCEDLAMQFLVSNITRLPPVYVKGHLNDLGPLGGISTSQNVIAAAHMDARSVCLNELVKVFKYNPLIKTHAVVDSITNRWSSAPSTWWEYISSDLWNFETVTR